MSAYTDYIETLRYFSMYELFSPNWKDCCFGWTDEYGFGYSGKKLHTELRSREKCKINSNLLYTSTFDDWLRVPVIKVYNKSINTNNTHYSYKGRY